jgi:hypothetical protein
MLVNVKAGSSRLLKVGALALAATGLSIGFALATTSPGGHDTFLGGPYSLAQCTYLGNNAVASGEFGDFSCLKVSEVGGDPGLYDLYGPG